MKVYAFQYCSCVFESTDETISLHTTKLGAYQAMRKHRLHDAEFHRSIQIGYGDWKDLKEGQMCSWTVKEMEVLGN